MRGHGQRLTRKQEALVGALLTEPTYAAAAAKVGISESSLYRWLTLPEVQAACRTARRQVIEAVIDRLQKAMSRAVETLERNLTCGQPSSEVRAALGILEQGFKAREVVDLAERLEELERRLTAERGIP
jgi:hypothetical protein